MREKRGKKNSSQDKNIFDCQVAPSIVGKTKRLFVRIQFYSKNLNF